MLVVDKFTDSDFESLKNGGAVTFDIATPKELVLDVVNRINDFEATFNTRDPDTPSGLPSITIDAKQCNTDVIVAVLDYAMKREDLVNASLILNVFNMVKLYNSLSDSYFESPMSYIKSIEEFIDVKAELAPTIKEVSTKLAFWYLSALYSIHKTEITVVDKVERVPNLYHSLILTSDLFTLSAIFNKGDNIQTKDLVLVESAYVYIVELANRLSMTNAFVMDIEKALNLKQ